MVNNHCSFIDALLPCAYNLIRNLGTWRNLADAHGLGPCASGRAGSSPAVPTTSKADMFKRDCQLYFEKGLAPNYGRKGNLS